MNKHIFLAMVSYVVLTMIVAYPWHMIWFHDVYVAMGAVTRPEPIVPFGMSAMVLQGWVIAYLYPFYYYFKGGTPIASGVKFSLLMGLMVYTVMVLANVAKFQIEPIGQYLAYGSIFQLIQYVVTGAALGLIYGRLARNPE
ncbi:MAG: hypothetical protein ACRBHB_12435 [Arenicella sp.]